MYLMSLTSFIVFGFAVGLLARALLPGKQSMGMLWTTVLGVAGSLVGGLVARAISHASTEGVHGAGFIGSLIGAFVLLWAYVEFARHKSRTQM